MPNERGDANNLKIPMQEFVQSGFWLAGFGSKTERQACQDKEWERAGRACDRSGEGLPGVGSWERRLEVERVGLSLDSFRQLCEDELVAHVA